jgi:hypothetical protein
MELTGKLIKMLEPESGEGKSGTWHKQTAVIETGDKYPKPVAVSFFGSELSDQIRKKFIGEDITVSINVESREYNERWYTEIKAWKIQ